MKYLYFWLEVSLYLSVSVLYLHVFARYRYHPAFERSVEERRKNEQWALVTFLGLFGAAVLGIFIVWKQLYPDNPHRIGYFTSFLVSGLLTLAFFHRSIRHLDLGLCLPSMAVVWFLLLGFEALLLHNNAGWIYTDSTVWQIQFTPRITIILENLIVFYVFAPFMSILIFTGLAVDRSDKTAFFLTNLIIWIGGVIWEIVSMGVFNLWTMVEERSLWAFDLFGARTTIEEMFYYVPFSSLSVLIYLALYYRKYHATANVEVASA